MLSAGGVLDTTGDNRNWRTLVDFALPNEPGKERLAMQEVTEAVKVLGLPEQRLERLKTAVAEATMNAMEHGNGYQSEVPVVIEVLASDTALSVRITDWDGSPPLSPDAEMPDLEAKLEGLQTPRGWGLFLIKNMVDEMRVSRNPDHHSVELVMRLEGDHDAS